MDDITDNGASASLDNDLWDVMQYSTDKKGRTNWLKIGRAWAKPEAQNITIKLFALPLQNREGDVIISLVPRE